MLYDFHAEAQARFANDTQPAAVSHETNRLKGAALGELLVDGIQTHDFLRKGICHEVDPLARPFVHSLPGAILGTAALSYFIVRLPASKLTNTLLKVFISGEGLNIIHNTQGGCS
jgi:hypothetical protein